MEGPGILAAGRAGIGKFAEIPGLYKN